MHVSRMWHFAALALVGCVGVSVGGSGVSGRDPDPKDGGEWWVVAQVEHGLEKKDQKDRSLPYAWTRFQIRVEGGPVKQMPAPPRTDGVKYRDLAPGVAGQEIDGGKRVVYVEDDRATIGDGKKFEDWRRRLMVVDADGKNPKQLLYGLDWRSPYQLTPDGKGVICGAEQDGKWYLFLVPLDGRPPKRLTTTPGVEHPSFRLLPDGRILCFVALGFHTEQLEIGTWTIGKGSVILLDGQKETVLFKDEIGGIPEMTSDVSKVARAGKDENGGVVVVTDLATGKSNHTPVAQFNKDWRCRIGALKFRPDGKALAVGFSLGNVVFRQKGPEPGDECVQHFGVIWLDGRTERTQLFKVDAPLKEHGYYPEVRSLDWSRGSDEKK
jgi:hypothetical protein